MEGSKTPGSISDDIEHHSMTEGSEDKTGNHAASQLPTEHHDYLLNRHGTAELDPVPSASDADPYNWPMWKKTINLILVAWHAMMGTFTASSIIPAYLDISKDLGVSLQQVSYLTSLQIAVLGVSPFLWKPIANRYGRRPIFLISLIGSLVCNIGCAKAPGYASLAACRALVAFFISPAGALGSAVVSECYFKFQRARFMGVWTLLITVGVPFAPFIMGFVAERVSYRWIFWVLAIINGAQLVLYTFFGPETLYNRSTAHGNTSIVPQGYFRFHRIDPKPLKPIEFVWPITMAARLTVLIPAIAYSMVFLFGSVMCSVEIPQLLQEKFELDAQGLGLQFISLIIGSVLGEQVGGPLSDLWIDRATRSRHRRPAPEYRLWLSYLGFAVSLAGMVVFLVQTEKSSAGGWNVTPMIGAAIAAFGTQIVTTVMVTYAVDTNVAEAASVGVFITLVRQIWGFIGPFWFAPMFANVGIANSAGVVSAMIIVASVLPTVMLHVVRGRKDAK